MPVRDSGRSELLRRCQYLAGDQRELVQVVHSQELQIVPRRLCAYQSAAATQPFAGLFLPFLRGCSIIASGPGNTRLV
jgi:hypothetical protein